MSQPIWYDSTEVGAPVLNNVAGSLLAVLRACLINGFNEKTVTSITVASEVATAACTGHGFLDTYGKLVEISGWGSQPLDGPKQISNVTTDTFDFAAPGVADGVYTPTGGGTILAYRAPLGWTEPHTGTNVAMFARSAVEATAMLLRVDDTGTNMARLRVVEFASDVNTFTGLTPTDVQLNGGAIWQKANSSDANAWFVVGTDRGFWYGTLTASAGKQFAYFWAGDGRPYYPADAYCCAITSRQNTIFFNGQSNPAALSGYAVVPSLAGGIFVAGAVGASASESEFAQLSGPLVGVMGNAALQPATGNRIAVADTLHIVSGATKLVRAEMPGLSAPLAAIPFPSMEVVFSSNGTAYLPVSFLESAGTNGQICIRLSGPWY